MCRKINKKGMPKECEDILRQAIKRVVGEYINKGEITIV